MVRFHWHVEAGQGAFLPPGAYQHQRDSEVCHVTCEVEIPNQRETLQTLLTLPAGYLDGDKIRDVGIVLGHGSNHADWKGKLLTEIAVTLAMQGFLVMRYCCSKGEQRRIRMFEKALDACATSPFGRNVVRWVLAGQGTGARVAAVVGTKCRGEIAGYALLSYPLKEVMLPVKPKKVTLEDAAAVPPTSEGPLLKIKKPVLLVVGTSDDLCPLSDLAGLAPAMPSTDVRLVTLPDADSGFKVSSTARGPTPAAVKTIADTVVAFVSAITEDQLRTSDLPKLAEALATLPPRSQDVDGHPTGRGGGSSTVKPTHNPTPSGAGSQPWYEEPPRGGIEVLDSQDGSDGEGDLDLGVDDMLRDEEVTGGMYDMDAMQPFHDRQPHPSLSQQPSFAPVPLSSSFGGETLRPPAHLVHHPASQPMLQSQGMAQDMGSQGQGRTGEGRQEGAAPRLPSQLGQPPVGQQGMPVPGSHLGLRPAFDPGIPSGPRHTLHQGAQDLRLPTGVQPSPAASQSHVHHLLQGHALPAVRQSHALPAVQYSLPGHEPQAGPGLGTPGAAHPQSHLLPAQAPQQSWSQGPLGGYPAPASLGQAMQGPPAYSAATQPPVIHLAQPSAMSAVQAHTSHPPPVVEHIPGQCAPGARPHVPAWLQGQARPQVSAPTSTSQPASQAGAPPLMPNQQQNPHLPSSFPAGLSGFPNPSPPPPHSQVPPAMQPGLSVGGLGSGGFPGGGQPGLLPAGAPHVLLELLKATGWGMASQSAVTGQALTTPDQAAAQAFFALQQQQQQQQQVQWRAQEQQQQQQQMPSPALMHDSQIQQLWRQTLMAQEALALLTQQRSQPLGQGPPQAAPGPGAAASMPAVEGSQGAAAHAHVGASSAPGAGPLYAGLPGGAPGPVALPQGYLNFLQGMSGTPNAPSAPPGQHPKP